MRINRTNTIHIFAIIAVLLMPVMFMRPEEKLTFTLYLFKCVTSIAMITVFYINFFWLVPKLISTEDKTKFIFINFVIIIIGAIIMMKMHGYEFRYFDIPNGIEPKPVMSMPVFVQVLIVFRDALNLILSTLLAYSIRMTEHAHRQNQLRQEAEVAKREAELRGLRFQLSPHFLLNTLNNIYALTAISAQRAQDAIMQLSQLLRHMLYESQEKKVSLKQETDFIRSYVDLMKLRFASNVTVNVDISVPDNDDITVAPLLFISLVENAFKHGISATQPSNVSISISVTENEYNNNPGNGGTTIRCHVSNTNFPKTDADRSGHGIGLKQVSLRLNATYKDHYRWTCGVDETDGLYHSEIVLW